MLGIGCNPVTAQTPTDGGEPKDSVKTAVWQNELDYQILMDDDKEAKQALKVAKKNGNFKDYKPSFRLGNLCFIAGSTPPPRDVMDASGKHGDIGVILGEEPKFVSLPNHALFMQFLKALRPNPDVLKPYRRYRAIAKLAGTGQILTAQDMKGDYFAQQYHIASRDPLWKDENGTLEIQYYTFQQSGMTAPILMDCKLVVDSENKVSNACEQVRIVDE